MTTLTRRDLLVSLGTIIGWKIGDWLFGRCV